MCWFTLQMAATIKCGASVKLGVRNLFLAFHMAGKAQAFVPSFVAFPGISVGKCIGSGVARIPTGAHTLCSGLSHDATMPVHTDVSC